jgi:hypothetical protein
MTAIVFLGPTLPRAHAIQVLEATYLPPARQGDIYRAGRALRPTAIGLVDGRFMDTGAIWHREILWALSEGMHVFGAASMGALRAAELVSFGMHGVGQIFAAYRDACWPGDDVPFEDDDEVAVVHAPDELGGIAISDAMVDLRATLHAAEAAGIITATDRCGLVEASKRRLFAERSFAALIEDAASLLKCTTFRDLAAWLPGNQVPRKRLDAIEMLQDMAKLLATRPEPFVADFVMQQPLFWRRFIYEADACQEEELDAAARVVIDRLRRDPAAWRACARAALGRIQSPAPRNASDTGQGSALRGALDRFRRDRGLWQRGDLIAWMEANALDEPGLEGLLSRENQLEWEATSVSGGLLRAMVDHLRMNGAFAAILRDARGGSR